MKKTKMIDTYYCDYCGKECEHTNNFVFPKTLNKKEYATNNHIKISEFDISTVVEEKPDICISCQMKIAALIKLTPTVKFEENSTSTIFLEF